MISQSKQSKHTAAKSAAWTALLFYLLIAFEFFYMATPFAAYFYGAYFPGLEFLSQNPHTAWLAGFFLPHFAASSSALIRMLPILGGLLTALGLVVFVFGAGQIYLRKLLKKGAAANGLYKWVRHPQYSALIIAGAGMVLLWPRFLTTVFYVTMLFVYRLLADIEERECYRKFGEPYSTYLRSTPRFIPFTRPAHDRSAGGSRQSKLLRNMIWYAITLASMLAVTFALRHYSVAHLYTEETADTIYVSLVPIERDALAAWAKTAEGLPEMKQLRDAASSPQIAYVMPWEWTVAEIPMQNGDEHRTPSDAVPDRLKIVYTAPTAATARTLHPRELLTVTLRTEPVGETWLDETGRAVRITPAPEKGFYDKLPVPVF